MDAPGKVLSNVVVTLAVDDTSIRTGNGYCKCSGSVTVIDAVVAPVDHE